MPRIDRVAVVTSDAEGTSAFYARIFGARIVETEEHPTDPDGRLLEAITYHAGEDPRRPRATGYLGVAYPRMPSNSTAKKRSARASVSSPGRSHV
jgi:catechol 2,3-dioxygenase-like lactoylglutathione lyase family enzyme